MTVNSSGEPVIASYWQTEQDLAPQYRVVWQDGGEWKVRQVGNRSQSFALIGGGTKRIPASRLQILAGDHDELYLVFRDIERGGGISVAVSQDSRYESWSMENIYPLSMGMWEPSFDPIVWQRNHKLHLFGQKVGQGDGETLQAMKPQEVFILEWTPPLYQN
jgi:hypothetical protein